jgi:hypothetical protein
MYYKRKDIYSLFSRENLIVLLPIVGTLFFAYFPVALINYFYHDDYYYFQQGWDRRSIFGYGMLHIYTFKYGRPLGGVIKGLYGMSFQDLEGRGM